MSCRSKGPSFEIIERFENEKLKNIFLVFVVPESTIADIPSIAIDAEAALEKINVTTIEEGLEWAKLGEVSSDATKLRESRYFIQKYAEKGLNPSKFTKQDLLPDSLTSVLISAKKERALNAKFPETKTLDGALNWAESYSGKEFKEAKEALLNYTKVDYNYLKSIPQYLMKVSEFIDHEKVKEDLEKESLQAEIEKLKAENESLKQDLKETLPRKLRKDKK